MSAHAMGLKVKLNWTGRKTDQACWMCAPGSAAARLSRSGPVTAATSGR